jgi:hypothetical protein
MTQRRITRWRLLLAWAYWYGPCHAQSLAETGEVSTPIAIGTRVEMFVDDRLIDPALTRALTHELQTPIRREVVLTTDKPWEGIASAYFTVFQDGARYRMYYRGSVPGEDHSENQVTCYAESADGIHFQRPSLGLHEFAGSKDNNIILRGVSSHNFAPFLDSNPDAKPEERYKALAGLGGELFAYASADGINWRKMQDAPVMTDGTFDSLNIGFWDEAGQCYRAYSRYFDQGGYAGARAVQNSTSLDFVHWTAPQPNRYAADAPTEHFYTSATIPCPGAPHHLLAFPMRFVPDRTKIPEATEAGVSDAVFMTSRDGQLWDRSFLEGWVRPGTDQRNWTHRNNMPAWGIVQTAPDEFSLYVSEHYFWPDNRLRRLTVRRHGFASMHAGAAEGEFTTRALTFTGQRLLLNYATSAAGSVRMEIQDEHGAAIPGFSLAESEVLFGDELDGSAQWKSTSDVSGLIGTPVRLRFVLRDADLFAFRTTAVVDDNKNTTAGVQQFGKD